MMRGLASLPRPAAADVLFSFKAFAASMLAVYVASRAGLERPFWAMMTAYIVASPLAGAVRSKALFRLCGTFIGSLATVAMVPALSNAPVLLTLALALWVAGCLYVSLLDRTPRSYVFMLAGYTAALVGFPSVQAPAQIFDTAVLRVEEIALGIVCATLVHSLVLPRGLAPSVLGLLERAQRDARHWLATLFGAGKAGEAGEARALQADRQRLAADLTQLRVLSTHIPFDTTNLRWTAGAVRAMQDRLAALTPALSAAEDRLRALVAAEGGMPADVARVLAMAEACLQAGSTQPVRTAAAARPGQAGPAASGDDAAAAPSQAEVRAALHALAEGAQGAWPRALRMALAQRLEELLDGWQACLRLRAEIDAGLAGRPVARVAALSARTLHRDRGLALLSSLAALAAIGLCSAMWIATGWPSGSVATMMAAVFCSFFATLDDPVPAINGFLKFTLWSVPVSTVYVLALLPAVQDFGMLVLVCAPTFLLLGCFVAQPATFASALALLVGVASSLALHDTAQADIVGFLNTIVAQVVGVLAAARVTRLIRSVGADWSARRIQRATWRELADMASAPRLSSGARGYAVRMLDRIGLLAPRIAQSGGSIEGVLAEDTLADLRVGADIVALQRVRPHLPARQASAVLAGVAGRFRRRAQAGARRAGDDAAPAAGSASLLADIDTLLQALVAMPPPQADTPAHTRLAVAALVGLRRNLFPGAPGALPALLAARSA